MDYRLRSDRRVEIIEGVNARHPLVLPEPVDLATIDVSFISLELVLPNVARCLSPGGELLALVKPQFEAGRGKVGKGGVIRDATIHAQVLSRMVNFVVDNAAQLRLRIRGITPSPILGDAGNREFFLYLKKGGAPSQ